MHPGADQEFCSNVIATDKRLCLSHLDCLIVPGTSYNPTLQAIAAVGSCFGKTESHRTVPHTPGLQTP